MAWRSPKCDEQKEAKQLDTSDNKARRDGLTQIQGKRHSDGDWQDEQSNCPSDKWAATK